MRALSSSAGGEQAEKGEKNCVKSQVCDFRLKLNRDWRSINSQRKCRRWVYRGIKKASIIDWIRIELTKRKERRGKKEEVEVRVSLAAFDLYGNKLHNYGIRRPDWIVSFLFIQSHSSSIHSQPLHNPRELGVLENKRRKEKKILTMLMSRDTSHLAASQQTRVSGNAKNENEIEEKSSLSAWEEMKSGEWGVEMGRNDS